jgi:hypothetical protein
MSNFNYENTETKNQQGGKIIRKVSIKKEKGYKSITKYHKGKKLYTIKKPLHKKEVYFIKKGIFIPRLFKDCKNCKTKKRKGGSDEEMGPNMADITPYPIPPDPERFKKYDEQFRTNTATPDEVEQTFAGPTPEAKQNIERNKMIWEDPLNKDPFEREDLKIFSDKGGTKRKRKMRGRK